MSPFRDCNLGFLFLNSSFPLYYKARRISIIFRFNGFREDEKGGGMAHEKEEKGNFGGKENTCITILSVSSSVYSTRTGSS